MFQHAFIQFGLYENRESHIPDSHTITERTVGIAEIKVRSRREKFCHDETRCPRPYILVTQAPKL